MAIVGHFPVILPRRVLVFGGRDFRNRDFLFEVLDKHHAVAPFACLIQGGQVSFDAMESHLPWADRTKWGADWFAREWAIDRGVPMIEEKANWRAEGRGAGPRRNQRMIDIHKPTFGIGFPGGSGTADMLRRLRKAGIDYLTTSRR